jgi:hypothetical protein
MNIVVVEILKNEKWHFKLELLKIDSMQCGHNMTKNTNNAVQHNWTQRCCDNMTRLWRHK